MIRYRNHRVAIIRSSPVPNRSSGLCVVPTGKDRGQPEDGILIVSGNGKVLPVERKTDVEVDSIEPDAEKLHDLTRVVLVWITFRICLVVMQHVEVLTHRWIKRHVFEQLPEISKRVAHEDIHVGRHSSAVFG